jgi:hypothetical protein
MLPLLPDLEAFAQSLPQKGIRQSSLRSGLKAPFQESFQVSFPVFLVRFWSVSDETASQNATVASSNSARPVAREHPHPAIVSAHKKGSAA